VVGVCLVISIFTLAAAAQTKPHATGKFRIAGTIVDAEDRQALPDIEVSLAVSQADTLFRTVTTGDDGRFEFDGLAANKYSMTARGRGYRQQGFQEHEGYFTGIVVGSGMTTDGIEFRLKPDASISGTVTDEFNDPAPAVHVILFRTGMLDNSQMVMMQSEVMTDDTGRYHFGRLQEGKYYLVAYGSPWYAREPEGRGGTELQFSSHGGHETVTEEETVPKGPSSAENRHSELDVAFRTTYYPNGSEAEQATPLTLKTGERASADFQMFAVPAVRLKVRGSQAFAGGTTSATLFEPIFNYSRQAGLQPLTENGAEISGLAPGHYVLRYPADGRGKKDQREPLDLVSDMEAGPGDRSRLTSSVTGLLQWEGAACSRCFVQLMNAASGEQFVAETTAKGFEFDGGVRAGRYNVALLNADDSQPRAIAAVGARVVGTQVEIPSGAAVQLTISMTKGLGTIDGTALQNGKPVSQAAVVLLPNDAAHNLILMRRDQSDSDGTFTLRRIVPGSYTVVAVADGWDLDWQNPAVVKAYGTGGAKVQVQAGGGKYQVKVAVAEKAVVSR